ncbi:hypothetical protein RFI_22790 [Reticulomyxa filosa]|uniref:Uncharacterized protein n=1 Tax=Reticulomyxa filosa TaxID=46433 RepID=X6MKN6_RETFI|nr:hypothetical protein RFI_22790 [Reticulomyxa filosa]|eukprot:ETO14578.1 hypothetical protein RFI_22790 [Reticulomyxa filosa]
MLRQIYYIIFTRKRFSARNNKVLIFHSFKKLVKTEQLRPLMQIDLQVAFSVAHFEHTHSKLSFQFTCSIPTHTWLLFYTTCALAKSLLLDDVNTNGKDYNSDSDELVLCLSFNVVPTIRRIHLTLKQMNKKNNLFVTVTFNAKDRLSILWGEPNVPSEHKIENDNDNDLEEENEIDDNENNNENDDQNIIDAN